MAIQFNCPNCGTELHFNYLKIGDEFKCTECNSRGIVPESGKEAELTSRGEINGKDISGYLKGRATPQTNSNQEDQINSYNNRFPAVKIVSALIKVVAWIVFVALVVFGFYAFNIGHPLEGIKWFIIGATILVFNLAFSEILLVILAIEENTRKSIKK
ncbi:MAG: hypothetical protein U9N55_04860 [candidate division Zixibacteria bacterium]|nr:hypothetical protein [candidate division Zixibacteria bacterium]